MSFQSRRYTLAEMLDGVVYVGTAKKLGYNVCTYTAPNGDKVIRQCRTDIVRRSPEGHYTISSGGYRTSTTKKHINDYAPVRLFQRKSEWFLAGRTDDGAFDFDIAIPFRDGIVVNADGIVIDIFDNRRLHDQARYDRRV
jgi:hypothetical protein